jgi:hypothetical protein
LLPNVFQRKEEEDANMEAIWGGSWKNDVLSEEPAKVI